MSEGELRDKAKAHAQKLKEWEYCYCRNCKVVRYDMELEATSRGIKCMTCGGFDLDPPVWIECPHRKGAVKCAAGGSGLIRDRTGYKCVDRCKFLML